MNIKVEKAALPFPMVLPWEPEDSEPIRIIDLHEKTRYRVTMNLAQQTVILISPDNKYGISIPIGLLIGYGPMSDIVSGKILVP